MGDILYLALEIYKWIVFVRCLLSFIKHDPYHPVIRFFYDITEPVMAPFRKLLPATAGVDFSPILVFFAIVLIQSLVIYI